MFRLQLFAHLGNALVEWSSCVNTPFSYELTVERLLCILHHLQLAVIRSQLPEHLSKHTLLSEHINFVIGLQSICFVSIHINIVLTTICSFSE